MFCQMKREDNIAPVQGVLEVKSLLSIMRQMTTCLSGDE